MGFQPEQPGIGNDDRHQRHRLHLQYQGRAFGQARGHIEGHQHRPAGHGKEQRARHRNPRGIGQPAPQDCPGIGFAAFTDGLAGHHLHTGKQPKRGGQHHAGHRPGQRMITQFRRAIAANHDGIDQPHRHDAKP